MPLNTFTVGLTISDLAEVCGPDDLADLAISLHASLVPSFRPPLSSDSVRRMIMLAFHTSLTQEEGRYPRFRLINTQLGTDGIWLAATVGPYTLLHTFGSDYKGVHRGITGMCLDSEGNIVACAGWERSVAGPMVYVFSPKGRILETQPVPTEPTNCTFGGAGLDALYVTTSEGHLYRVRAIFTE